MWLLGECEGPENIADDAKPGGKTRGLEGQRNRGGEIQGRRGEQSGAGCLLYRRATKENAAPKSHDQRQEPRRFKSPVG
jgi:hypothetical protein